MYYIPRCFPDISQNRWKANTSSNNEPRWQLSFWHLQNFLLVQHPFYWLSNKCYCARSWELGSQCRPNECTYIWIWKTLGGRDFGAEGVYEPGEGNGEVSLRATWIWGGRILSQQGGFQVSREGLERGTKGNKRKARSKGINLIHVTYVRVYKRMPVVIEWYQLYICIIIIAGMNAVDNLNSV